LHLHLRCPEFIQHFWTRTFITLPSDDVLAPAVVSSTPGFVFLVKSFGAFCASTVDVASLPRSTRRILGLLDDHETDNETNGVSKQQQQQQQQQRQQQQPHRVSYASMPEEAKADLWTRFHAALEPIRSAGKLACVVFQFHLSFPLTPQSGEHVEHLRLRLDGGIRMAVEFRNREWVVGREGDATAAWCRTRGLALVAADELHHETVGLALLALSTTLFCTQNTG
jgi:uncharacterized protein YecE (DUF72 family)